MIRYSNMESRISSQFKYWKGQKDKVDIVDRNRDRSTDHIKKPYVTISREYGCFGFSIAEKITDLLNFEKKSDHPWAAYNKELLDKVMKDMGLSTGLMETMTGNARKTMTDLLQTYFDKFPPQVAVYRKLAETVRVLAEIGNVVLVGRAGNIITREIPRGLHVRIIASMEFRVKNIAQARKIGIKEAEKVINEKTRERDSFIREYLRFDSTESSNYDMVINNSSYTADQAANLIIGAMRSKGLI